MRVAFDCDGTLIGAGDKPREHIIEILKGLHRAGFHICVWSGGGLEYAQRIVHRLGIENYVDEVRSKLQNDGSFDVAFDDMDATGLARELIRV